MSIWYHGTSEKNSISIINNGFTIPKEYGIWGCGVYLTDNINEAKQYGDIILKVEIDDSLIMKMDYVNEIANIFKELSIQDEEGTPELRDYILNKGKKGVVVKYVEDEINLIVYDVSVLDVTR